MNSIIEAQLELDYCKNNPFRLFSFESVTENIPKAFYKNSRINDNHVMTFDPNELLEFKSIIV